MLLFELFVAVSLYRNFSVFFSAPWWTASDTSDFNSHPEPSLLIKKACLDAQLAARRPVINWTIDARSSEVWFASCREDVVCTMAADEPLINANQNDRAIDSWNNLPHAVAVQGVG